MKAEALTSTQSSTWGRWELGLFWSPPESKTADRLCQSCPHQKWWWWWGGHSQVPLLPARQRPEGGLLLFEGRRPQGQREGVGGLFHSRIDSRCSAGLAGSCLCLPARPGVLGQEEGQGAQAPLS